MKKTFIAMMMAAAVLFSCTEKEPLTPNEDEKNPEQQEPGKEDPGTEDPGTETPDPVYVSFVKNSYIDGAQKAVVMDVLETVNVTVEAQVSAEAEVEVAVEVDETYIAEYNELDAKNYEALPADLYTVTTAPVMEGLTAKFNVTFDVAKILAYAETNGKTYTDMSNYAVALKLTAEGAEVATEDEMSLGYYVMTLQVLESYLSAVLTPVSDLEYELVVSVPFTNESCNVTWDVEFAQETIGTEPTREKGNVYPAKYQQSAGAEITNVEVKSMAPETSEVVYTITYPSYQVLNTEIKVSNAKIDGMDVPVKSADETGVWSAVVELKPYNMVYKTKSWDNGNYGETLYSEEGEGLTSEVALWGKSLESAGLKAMDCTGFIFNPVCSCNYFDANMVNNVFDDKQNTDWGVMWSAADGSYTQAWGWDSIKDSSAENPIPGWALVDMGKKQAVEGIEYWRKANKGGQAFDINVMEIYALETCTYTWKTDDLTYNNNDLTYLGTIQFDGPSQVAANVLAAKFERIETQYILIVYRAEGTRNNNLKGLHAHEIKFFN